MSTRTAIMATLRSTSRSSTMPIVGRGFTFSSTHGVGLKESSDPDNIDYGKHRDDAVAKAKTGGQHWKRELASDSEEAVKADKSQKEDTASLQERTKGAAEDGVKRGTSWSDGM